MDADSFPPLPTSPGNCSAPWGTPSPQTPVEPTNKTLSEVVRKGPYGVSSPQQRHAAANPPPGLGRGRGRGALPETPLEEPGERRKDTELEPSQKLVPIMFFVYIPRYTKFRLIRTLFQSLQSLSIQMTPVNTNSG